MIRTTIRMDEHLFRQAKQFAVQSHLTLTAVIEDALREKLGQSRSARQTPLKPLPVFHGDGLQPGVDLDDSASLLDVMEGGAPMEQQR